MSEPVILAVDDDPQVLTALRSDLRSRYREDYRVLAASSGATALETIRELKARGDALAMVITDQRMPSMLGVDVLAKTTDVYPIARRVLLTAYSDVRAAIRAINEAHVDHYLEKPWDPPDEHLYPAIDDLLGAWQAEHRPEITGLRLIGRQWSPRSHDAKDFLASNLIPYRWLDAERDPAARSLTGMTYRHHTAEGIAACTGAGFYYGATVTEAHSCHDRRVFVVGGGNSAGQGAVHLSRYAREVNIVVRKESLNETMSRYLIDQISAIPHIQVRYLTTIERVEGSGHLERVWLRSAVDDSLLVEEADAVFAYIGTRPRSDWLPAAVLRDAKGFVLTGPDVAAHEAFGRMWKEGRPPMPLETSVPGVFAAGDLRSGAMNRVASAVGEGAMAVRLVLDYLART